MPQVPQEFIDQLARFLLITRHRAMYDVCYSYPKDRAEWKSTLLTLQKQLREFSGPVVTCWMCDPPQKIELVKITEHDETVHNPQYVPPEPETPNLSHHPEMKDIYCSFPGKLYLHPPGNICKSIQRGQYQVISWVTPKGGPHDFTSTR